MNKPILDVFDDAADQAAGAAREIARELEIVMSDYGMASLVVTGGRSPGAVYDALSQADIDWEGVGITLSDERWVEPTSPDSNEKLVRDRLLVGKAAAANFAPLKRAVADVNAAADQAEPDIAALAPFDVVLLGMGEDGHIASLFPGNPVLADGLNLDNPRHVIGVPKHHPAPNMDRISLTLSALRTARLTLVLVSGEAKREMITAEHGRPIHALLDAAQGKVRILWTP